MIENITICTAVAGCWKWCDKFAPVISSGSASVGLSCSNKRHCERVIKEAAREQGNMGRESG